MIITHKLNKYIIIIIYHKSLYKISLCTTQWDCTCTHMYTFIVHAHHPIMFTKCLYTHILQILYTCTHSSCAPHHYSYTYAYVYMFNVCIYIHVYIVHVHHPIIHVVIYKYMHTYSIMLTHVHVYLVYANTVHVYIVHAYQLYIVHTHTPPAYMWRISNR